MKRGWIGLGVVLALALAGCRTTSREMEPRKDTLEPQIPFQPATAVAPIRCIEGSYPDLFGRGSYAVWVVPEVAAAKREAQAEQGTSPIDPATEAEAAFIAGNFIVIECHIESAFADMQISYDAVRLLGIDAYLETPDGRKIRYLQRVPDAHVEEESVGALKRFRRVHLLIFPKSDVWTHASTLDPESPTVRLVLAGHGSVFAFEWPGLPPSPDPEHDAAWEAFKADLKTDARAVEVGFSDLFDRLTRLSHVFD